MGINFPASPTVGTLHPNPAVVGVPQYTWDGEKWTTPGAGGLSIYVSDTPPGGAADNSLWFESDTGLLYLRYRDADSVQWVLAAPQPDTSSFVSTNAQTLTTVQQSQARKNIYAAPFDVMGYSGMQVNGGFDVSQEYGTSGVVVPGTGDGAYVTDGWFSQYLASGLALSATVGNYAGPGNLVTGVNGALALASGTGVASVAAGDFVMLSQHIEGYRWSRMNYGISIAQPVTIAFWIYASKPGTASLAVRNSGLYGRSYVAPFTVNAATTWEYKTITIPGDVAGTWNSTLSGATACITISMLCGATFHTPTPNAWVNGNFIGVAGQTNFFSTGPNSFYLNGLVVLPGIDAPTKERFTTILRPYDQELLLCQRYYEKQGIVLRSDAAIGHYEWINWMANKRAAPTAALSGLSYSGGNTGSIGNINATGVEVFFTATAANGYMVATLIGASRV